MYLIIKMPKAFAVHELEVNNRWGLLTYTPTPIDDARDGAEGNLFRNTVFKATTEEDARAFAGRLVEENPGYEIWIAPASMVLQGTKPEVIEKRITKDGVLPV